MKDAKKVCLFLAVIFFYSLSDAQKSQIDSLTNLLKKDLPKCAKPCIGDTSKVTHLNTLAWVLSYNNSDTALLLSTEALRLSEKILENNKDLLVEREIKIGLATSLYQIGSFYDDKDEYALSMDYYTKAMNLWNQLLAERNTDKVQVNRIKVKKGATLSNIGIVYRKQGDLPKALDYYFQSLKIDEEIGDKEKIATDLGNIGVIYHKQKDYPKTLDYYSRALKIDEEMKDLAGVARHLGNIGSIHADQKSYSKALEFYFKAFKINEELNNKGSMARNLGNIGSVYFKQKDNIKALDYFMRSLKIREELGSKNLIAGGLRAIGLLYKDTKKYKDAEDYLQRSLKLSTEAGSLEDVKVSHESLSSLYVATGDYYNALDHFQKAADIKDSIYGEEKDKEITRKTLTYEFEKKEAVAKAEQEKKDVLADANRKKERLVLVFVSIGLVLVFVFAGFIFRSLRVTRRQKKLIEDKNRQTEEQKLIIEKQKEIVEEKNKDIIDSINYAKRIQNALLKEQESVSKHLPDHFILFKPKDIVSGDFYWMLERESQLYVAAVDCTGHGVPGAFLSMLGVSFLNEITSAAELFSPAEILNLLRKKVVKELSQSGKHIETNDGMDMSIIRLDLKTKKLQWAGANNPLYIVKDGILDEIKPDKQCIGYNDNMQPFANHEMQLESGMSFYLFTDGYADQFGGEKGKKFKYSQLKSLLLSSQHMSVSQQKSYLSEVFESWKGHLEQIDDVCVIGVRV